ncbi:MAG: hypothetical protein ACNA8N_04535 [Trueperaceae bacterium]
MGSTWIDATVAPRHAASDAAIPASTANEAGTGLAGVDHDHAPALDGLPVFELEEVLVRRRRLAGRARGHDRDEVALADDRRAARGMIRERT